MFNLHYSTLKDINSVCCSFISSPEKHTLLSRKSLVVSICATDVSHCVSSSPLLPSRYENVIFGIYISLVGKYISLFRLVVVTAEIKKKILGNEADKSVLWILSDILLCHVMNSLLSGRFFFFHVWASACIFKNEFVVYFKAF